MSSYCWPSRFHWLIWFFILSVVQESWVFSSGFLTGCLSGGACLLLSWRFVIQKEPPKSESRAPAAPAAAPPTTSSRYSRFTTNCAAVWYLTYRTTQQVDSNIGERVGTIWKKWPGFNEERNMDHEYFGLDGESGFVKWGRVCLLNCSASIKNPVLLYWRASREV